MRAADRMTLACVVANLLSAISLFPLTRDRWFLGLCLVLTCASALLALAARRLGGTGEFTAQLALLVPGVLLVGWSFLDLGEVFAETAELIATSTAPMAAHAGFRLLSALTLWLLFAVTVVLTVGLSRPGWTFPVLVLPYLIPAIVLPEEAHPFLLVLATIGYVLILGTAVYNRFTEAGTPPQAPKGMRRGVGRAAVATLVAGWLLTGLGSAMVPERSTALLDPGQLNTSVQLGDPTLDLIRNLRSPSDRVILSYRPSDGQGHYLRLAALSSLDAAGFHLVATDLMTGSIGSPQGMDVRPERVTIDVTVGDFGSEWLPAPWVPQAFTATGDWRFDPGTLAIVAIGDNRKLATRFLEYSVTSWDLRPGRDAIIEASAGDPGDEGLSLGLPPELDPAVLALADEVTADATTAGERVLALLTWLRSEEFTYSTELIDGSTMGTVSDFLLNSRTGYCEQFAGAMAILARAVDIPSRVVVGFLPGAETEEGFDVSVRDMHAWTEVYLTGLGWVALDPTPSGAPGVEPVPTASATPTPTASPTTSATSRPSPTPTTSRPAQPGAGGLPPALPAWTGGILIALALAAMPTAIRRWRGWRRLRPGRDPVAMAEDAWDELRDVTLDTGHEWPVGTPRQVAARLAEVLDPQAAAAAAALARDVERARFAPALEDGSDIAGHVTGAITGLQATRGARFHPLHRLLPRSVLRLRR